MSSITTLAFLADASLSMAAPAPSAPALAEAIEAGQAAIKEAKLQALQGALAHLNEAMSLSRVGSFLTEEDASHFKLAKGFVCREIRRVRDGLA
jgi:hypothetical protein